MKFDFPGQVLTERKGHSGHALDPPQSPPSNRRALFCGDRDVNVSFLSNNSKHSESQSEGVTRPAENLENSARSRKDFLPSDPGCAQSTRSTIVREDASNQQINEKTKGGNRSLNHVRLDSDLDIVRLESDVELDIIISDRVKHAGGLQSTSDSSGDTFKDMNNSAAVLPSFGKPGPRRSSKSAFGTHVGKLGGAFSASKIAPFDQAAKNESSTREHQGILRQFRILVDRAKACVFRSVFQYHPAPTEEDHSHFIVLLEQVLRTKMAWYFRASVYWFALALVLILCCCVWLVPLRLFSNLINAACLVRAARSTGGDTLLSVFLARELVLDDGFSRMNSSLVSTNLRQSRKDLSAALDAMRFGGTIAMEGNTVATGADSLNSDAMNRYKDIMYQVGRWGTFSTSLTYDRFVLMGWMIVLC